MTTHKVYSGFNSPFLVTITDVQNITYTSTAMGTITRCRLKYIYESGAEAAEADSAIVAHADVFDISTYASTGQLKIDIGPLDFTAGRDSTAELVIYDTTNPLGRVVCQLDIQVSDEMGSGGTASAIYASRTITASEELVLKDFYRRSIRFNSTSNGTLTFPVMTEAYNGEKIKFIIENTGDLTLACQGDTTIINETLTSITGTTRYGSITLEYDYALDTLTIDKAYGKWDD